MTTALLVRLRESPADGQQQEFLLCERLLFHLIQNCESQKQTYVEIFDDCRARCWTFVSAGKYSEELLGPIPESICSILFAQMGLLFANIGEKKFNVHFEGKCDKTVHAILVCLVNSVDVFWECSLETSYSLLLKKVSICLR